MWPVLHDTPMTRRGSSPETAVDVGSETPLKGDVRYGMSIVSTPFVVNTFRSTPLGVGRVVTILAQPPQERYAD
jgi:hypothetical protein